MYEYMRLINVNSFKESIIQEKSRLPVKLTVSAAVNQRDR